MITSACVHTHGEAVSRMSDYEIKPPRNESSRVIAHFKPPSRGAIYRDSSPGHRPRPPRCAGLVGPLVMPSAGRPPEQSTPGRVPNVHSITGVGHHHTVPADTQAVGKKSSMHHPCSHAARAKFVHTWRPTNPSVCTHLSCVPLL